MKFQLLGTGSADGWPNPFCTCDSCEHQRKRGIVRVNSCALIDDVILVDPGPSVPASCAHHRVSLSKVTDILVTHGHPDHCAPSIVLFHHWVDSAGSLRIWGPPEALEQFRAWLAPDQKITLHPVAPGDVVDLGSHTVHVIAAAHAHGDGDLMALEAVLYRIHRDDAVALYATDTGPLSENALESLRNCPLDLLIIDATFGAKQDHGTGHHDFSSLDAELTRLGDIGAVVKNTRVIATHLSHHNPAEPALREALASMGARPGRDGEIIDTSTRLGRLILVTGGARSGKSRYAESLAARHGGAVTYVATAPQYPNDLEWRTRIALHRDRRPHDWTSVETGDAASVIAQALPSEVVLIDCLGMWLTRLLDEHDGWETSHEDARLLVSRATEGLVATLQSTKADVLIVTNEVGMGIVPDTSSGRLFRDLIGIVNAHIAACADEVVLMVAGRPLIMESP